MSAKGRLIVAVVLFLAWIGFLSFLVIGTRDRVILSPPQFYAAPLHVIAKVNGDGQHPEAHVTVQEVAYAPAGADEELVGVEIRVSGLATLEQGHGWEGPGDYILPLQRRKDSYQLVPIPVSPTYGPPPLARMRIYPATAQARRQLHDIVARLRQAEPPASKPAQ